MDYQQEEMYDYFLNKIIDLKIELRENKKKVKELQGMHNASQEVIKNLKIQNTTLITNNKTLWDNLNKEENNG
jgi:seryl-tRNA synthetase